MSAGGLPAGGETDAQGSRTASRNWHGSCGRAGDGNHAAHSGGPAMDKFESFIFSVALVAAGLITLVTLPLA